MLREHPRPLAALAAVLVAVVALGACASSGAHARPTTAGPTTAGPTTAGPTTAGPTTSTARPAGATVTGPPEPTVTAVPGPGFTPGPTVYVPPGGATGGSAPPPTGPPPGAPAAVVLTAADSGRTVSVRRGQGVAVNLRSGELWAVPVSSDAAVLARTAASADRASGDAAAMFSAVAAGSARITSDHRCLPRPGRACALYIGTWRVAVIVSP